MLSTQCGRKIQEATENLRSFVKFSLFVSVQFIARRRGDGTEESSEAGVWRGNAELLLRGGLHLREHRERTVLFHLAGQSFFPARSRSLQLTHTHSYIIPFPLPHLPQERQSIIKYWMDNLRAKHGEVLHNINFLEGQPISKSDTLLSGPVVCFLWTSVE